MIFDKLKLESETEVVLTEADGLYMNKADNY